MLGIFVKFKKIGGLARGLSYVNPAAKNSWPPAWTIDRYMAALGSL